MYECQICHGLNHPSRLHCATCGTTPKHYSILGTESRYLTFDEMSQCIEVREAKSVLRAVDYKVGYLKRNGHPLRGE